MLHIKFKPYLALAIFLLTGCNTVNYFGNQPPKEYEYEKISTGLYSISITDMSFFSKNDIELKGKWANYASQICGATGYEVIDYQDASYSDPVIGISPLGGAYGENINRIKKTGYILCENPSVTLSQAIEILDKKYLVVKKIERKEIEKSCSPNESLSGPQILTEAKLYFAAEKYGKSLSCFYILANHSHFVGSSNPEAQYYVGHMLEQGLGIKKDLNRAKIWYRRSAMNGGMKATERLKLIGNVTGL